jgi:hypothetical protein
MPFCESVRPGAEDSVGGLRSAVGICGLEVEEVEEVLLLAMSLSRCFTMSRYFTQHWILLGPGHGLFGCVIELALYVFNATELLRQVPETSESRANNPK